MRKVLVHEIFRLGVVHLLLLRRRRVRLRLVLMRPCLVLRRILLNWVIGLLLVNLFLKLLSPSVVMRRLLRISITGRSRRIVVDLVVIILLNDPLVRLAILRFVRGLVSWLWLMVRLLMKSCILVLVRILVFLCLAKKRSWDTRLLRVITVLTLSTFVITRMTFCMVLRWPLMRLVLARLSTGCRIILVCRMCTMMRLGMRWKDSLIDACPYSVYVGHGMGDCGSWS